MKKQRIYFNPEKQIFRAGNNEDGSKYLEGYAALYNTRSHYIMDYSGFYFEEIKRGAFDNVLNSNDLDVVLVFNHKNDNVMARTSNKTLVLESDDIGLKFRAELANVSYANDTHELVSRGDLFQMSFAMILNQKDFEKSKLEDGSTLRTINNVSRLYDVSVVTRAAYPETNVIARDEKQDEPEPETEEPETEEPETEETEEKVEDVEIEAQLMFGDLGSIPFKINKSDVDAFIKSMETEETPDKEPKEEETPEETPEEDQRSLKMKMKTTILKLQN